MFVCVCVVRTLELTVIENLKLTLVTVLHVGFLEPAHLIPECFVLAQRFYTPHTQSLAVTILLCFCDFDFLILCVSEIV